MSIKDKYCIVGAATTKFGRLPGMTALNLTAQAAKMAIEDAGLKKNEVDAVFCKYQTSGFRHQWAHKVAESLGIQPKMAATVDQAGATNVGLVQYAVASIEAGLIDTAVCCYGDNPLTGSPATYAGFRGSDAAFGYFGAAPGYAMIAQRHMIEFGTTSRQLGAVAAATRTWASMNPDAQKRDLITIDDHQRSRYITWPLRLLDCCLVSDGAAAVVITSAERSGRLHKKPVYIMGMGQHHIAWEEYYRSNLTTSGAKISGDIAFKMAGITPQDVDVCQLYDCFTIVPIITLEDYGFCTKGEGGPFVEDGKTGPGGSLPMNTSGGLHSAGGTEGMLHIVEAVRQLRNECGERQVKDAEIALVSGQGGVMHAHGTLVLRR
ncbi:thiolase family protein [Thermodesulfobacteriota bacterium]